MNASRTCAVPTAHGASCVSERHDAPRPQGRPPTAPTVAAVRNLRDGRCGGRADRPRRSAPPLPPRRQHTRRGGVVVGAFHRSALRPPLSAGACQLTGAGGLDWALQRCHRPADGLGRKPDQRAVPGLVPGDGHALLSLAAVPDGHRLCEPVQPQCWADQCPPARRGRRTLADVQRLLDGRPGAGDGAAHLPVRVPAGVERPAVGRRLLRGGGADPWGRPSAHRAARDTAADRAGGAGGHAAGVRECDRPVRVAGDPRPAGAHRHAAHAHLRPVRLSTPVRAGLGSVAAVHRRHRGRALFPAPLPRPPLLRHGRRQGGETAADRPGADAMGPARLLRWRCSRWRSCCPTAR